MAIAALVLAAGASRRFGSDKRLHPVDGQPMLARTLATYRQVLDEVGVVIRPGQPAIAALVRTAACRPIEAADAAAGLSRSLAAGVAALRHADGLLIGLGDMPFVAPATLRALLAAMTQNAAGVVRPRYGGVNGNPVGFPPSSYDALTRLTGDAGARELLAKSAGVLAVDVDDAGVLQDVDHKPAPAQTTPATSPKKQGKANRA